MYSDARSVSIAAEDNGDDISTDRIHEIWGQTRSFVLGSTFTSKVVSVVLVSGYWVYFLFPSSALTLALIPDRTLPGVWNLVTAGYFEMSLVSVCFDTAALMLLGRTVEPIWGPGEFIKFITVVNAITGFTTFMFMYTLYVITRDNFYLYAKFGGFHGVIAGLLVAVKQLTPEDELIPVGPLKLRAKRFLGLYVLGATLLCILSGGQHHHIGFYFFTLVGCYIGWLYLRFFQVTPAGVGDPSVEFAFEMLFPDALRPFMQRVGKGAFSIFCQPAMPTHASAAVPITPAHVSVVPTTPKAGKTGSTPGSDEVRRKELAERGERLLQERLGGVSATIEKLSQATGTTMKRVTSSSANLGASDATGGV